MSTSLWNFESKTPSAIVDRGRAYHRRGRVISLQELAEGEWQAHVKGTSNEYEVNISMEGDTLTTWDCDCPYDWDSMCKHVAATLFKIREKTPQPSAETIVADDNKKRRLRAQEILAKFADKPAASPASQGGATAEKVENSPSAEVSKALAAAGPRSPEDLLALYDTLPEAEQRMLKLASVVWETFSKTKFTEIFNAANFKFQGLQLNDRTATPVFANFVALGFFQKQDSRFRVQPTFAQLLCDRDFAKDPDFARTLIPLRRYMELSLYWHHGYEVGERYFREMRLARYEGTAEKFKTYFFNTIQRSSAPNAWTQARLLEWWLPVQFDLKRMQALPPAIRWFLLEQKLSAQMFDLLPSDGYFHYAVEQLPSIEIDAARHDIARLAAQLLLLQGKIPEAEKALAHTGTTNALALRATAHLMQGQTAAANDAFALAAKTLRSETRNPKNFLTNLAGIMQVIGQLKTLDATLYPKISDFLTRALKNAAAYTAPFHYLQAVLLFLQNEKTAARAILLNTPPSNALFRYFWHLVQFWVDESLIDRQKLAEYQQELEAKGYHWLAAETLALLAELMPENAAHQERLTQRLAELGTEPFAFALPRVEDWENALNALLGMGASAKPAVENDSRLVWFVDFERRQLQAKEQTYGKKGWTAGRVVADSRLASGDVKNMTEQDRRIAKSMGYTSSGYYYSYTHDFDKACAAMVGHPLLFLAKSPDVAVQLIEEKPTLLAKQTDNGFQLRFSHPIEGEGVKVLKESPTRYKLLTVSAEQARIARALNGQSLFVPDRGADRLREAVSSLANIITVQSVFEDENLPSVPPDARPCLHLLPVGNGFHAEMLAKPFGDTPPYFKTGDGEPSVTALREGQRVRTTRDLKAERKNAEAFREQVEVLRENRPRNGVWELEDADQCLELLTQIHQLVQAGSIILEWPKGEKFRVTQLVGFDQFRMNVRQQNDWFEVSGEIRVDEDRVLSMQELLALSERSKGQFVELSPGKFLALTQEFRRRLQQINGLMAPQRNGSLQLHPLAAPALEDFTGLLKNFEFDQKFKENRERLRTAFSAQFKLPKNFNAQLRPYQREGFEWLSRCAAGGVGACLADDMGLGKTVQALALLTARAPLGPALVVAPASVCRTWMAETEKFAPALTPKLFGEGDREAMIGKAKKADIVVVTYDLMAREAEHFTQKKWATVILDEAQNIKNRATKRSETAMQLQTEFKLIMTGTPLENHLGELWNLFQFANPGLLGSLDSFNERFATPIEKYADDNRRSQLRRLVQPFILRRRKDEVLKELPAKTEITLSVELSPEERAFYEALRRTALEKLAAEKLDDVGGGEKHLRILAEIMRLRRAACHPQLVDPNAGFTDSSKLRLFGEIVDELLDNGHKALVFSQFVTHLQILEAHLKQKKIAYQYLDGQTPLPARQKRIEAFQRGEGDLFLISLKAGGVGLNLTAADYVIHMDPWWNPAVEDQATDRAHRIGQEKPVTVYRLVAEATIEEKILKLHEHKRDLADGLLSGADMSAKLSADDLLKLIAER
jgi:superfamily II DNA or RNA helicase